MEVNARLVGKILCILVYGVNLVMGFILSEFFKFHIKLILENKTTIETLDHKGKEFQSKYDKGKWNNWIEVMGITKWLWFFPIKLYQGKPKGNGIDWGIEEEMMPSYLKDGNEEDGEEGKNNESQNKLNDEKEMDKTGLTISKNDVAGISPLLKKEHGSMDSLYQ